MLVLLSLLACSGPEGPQPDPVAAREAASTFCLLLEGVEAECTPSGATATALGHELVFSVVRDKDLTVSGQLTAEYTFDVSVDGAPVPLGAVVLATGPGEAGAAAKAANDWGSIYGAPLADRYLGRGELVVLQSLQDKQSPPPAFEHSGWIAYPGWTYLVGKQQEKQPLRLGPLLQTMAPTIEGWDKADGATHTLLVSMSFRPGYAPDTHCAVDGQLSPTLCEQAGTYPWPGPGDAGYVLKQYFVLTPGTLTPPVPPAEAEAEEEPS